MEDETKWTKFTRWADRQIRPFAIGALLVGLMIDAWLAFCADVAVRSTFFAPTTIFVSALLATCGWMWTGHINRRLACKHQAMNLLLALRQPAIEEYKYAVYLYIDDPKNVPFPQKEVDRLLGFYEFMSISVMNGTADEDIIRESQSFVYWRLANGLATYLIETQEEERSIYCHFTHYAEEWNKDRKKRPSFIVADKNSFIPAKK